MLTVKEHHLKKGSKHKIGKNKQEKTACKQ